MRVSRNRKMLVIGAGALLALGVITVGIVRQSGSSEQVSVPELAQRTHFHGIAVDPNEPKRLLLATHHGLYTVRDDGGAERISETTDDFMGFMPHPTDAAVLYASGHPSGGAISVSSNHGMPAAVGSNSRPAPWVLPTSTR